MMQGFYWDVEPGGVWYNTLANSADQLGRAGFDGIWLPPPSKGAAGGFDVGYTPYDYYDLGEYDSRAGDQTSGNGAFIPTRYGTKSQLLNAIGHLKDNGLEIYADIVLNHRSGGTLEENVYAEFFTNPDGGSLFSPDGESTFTAFPLTNGSGRIAWPEGEGNEAFFPNSVHNQSNTGDFESGSQLAGFHQMYVNSFGYTNALHTGTGETLAIGDSLKAWGDWLTETLDLDGYRFDFVKGIHPEYFKDFMSHGAMQGKFHVHELYDGDLGRKQAYLEMLNTQNSPYSPSEPAPSAAAIFDFNMRFAYKAMSAGGNDYDIREWHNRGLINQFGVPFEQIVMFVDNHDFDRTDYNGEVNQEGHDPVVENKVLAYAHMLTHPGYAQVWWRDYFIYGLQDDITLLTQVRNQFGGGSYKALTRPGEGGGNPFFPGNPDEDPRHIYVAERSGTGEDSGLIVAINKHSDFNIDVWVDTQWPERELYDLSGNFEGTITAEADGRARIQTQASSYHIFVPVEFELEEPSVNIALNEIESPRGTRFIEESITPRVNLSNESLFGQQDVDVEFSISDANGDVIYAETAAFDSFGAGENRSLSFPPLVFEQPGNFTATAELSYEADQDDSDNLVETSFEVVDPNASEEFRIDGIFNEPQYVLMAAKQNENAGFGPDKNVEALYYYADGDSLYIGVEGELVIDDFDGIGMFLDFDELSGQPAGTPLGGVSGATSFLNPDAENADFAMDFEVDYGLAWIGAQDNLLMSVADYTGEAPQGLVVLEAGDSPAADGTQGVGPAEASGRFPAESIRYAMLNDGEAATGIEMAFALSDLGVSGGQLRSFGFIVSGTAYFSNVLVPGNAEGDADEFGNFGFNADFSTIEGGPFHSEWFSLDDATDIIDSGTQLPEKASLDQNYPNPFNPSTTIRYAVPESGKVTLEVYNLLGQRVAVLIDDVMQAGTHQLSFDARNLASGVYLYRLNTSGQVLTRKMTLVK